MSLRKMIFTLLLIFTMFACGDTQTKKINPEDYQAELRGNANDFMIELKSVLQKNMKEGGPLMAVAVCADTAQLLTNKYAGNKNLIIKRVSLKNRNPKNVPDNFEEQILNTFENLSANGKLTPETEVIKMTTENGTDMIRFMKPIIIESNCLLCHGQSSEILPQVAEIIKNNYPYDKAIGYKIGDLRGAISISKKL
jgi:hypothetical protein